MRIAKPCVVGLVCFAAIASAGKVAVGDPPVEASRRARQIRAQNSRSIVAVRSPEGNKLSALSLVGGGIWQTYTAPPGTELSAHVLGDLLGLVQEGPEVKEVAVFDAHTGDWTTQALPGPAKGVVRPVIIQDSVIFPVGKCVYAYRSAERRWKTLTLPTDEAPVVMSTPHAFLVQQGNRLFVYSAMNGAWSDGADAEPPRDILMGSPVFQSVSPKGP